ncbi:hypothetical protein [Methylobacterium longum]|uniref:Uncharacterized protein n=1 Tax=Methylobacterium longum TaxID=767694 RepID=A0ABT8AK50_9HYPH|nr:hypothetical protein [Methylobacterium longum]MDN3570262.1 hypothetical protein [Methylobacterium longum]
MFIFALAFGALAVLGAAVGLGHVGHPIGGQSIEHYGWALFINGLAIATLFAVHGSLVPSERKIGRKTPSVPSIEPAQLDRAITRERITAAPEVAVHPRRRRSTSLTPEPSQATVVLPDDPEAILDALIERVGTAGVDLMLRNRTKFTEAAA